MFLFVEMKSYYVIMFLVINWPTFLCAVIVSEERMDSSNVTQSATQTTIETSSDASLTALTENLQNDQPLSMELETAISKDELENEIPETKSATQEEVSKGSKELQPEYRWRNGVIPWRIHPPFRELVSYDATNRLRDAMREIESNSCVRFIELPSSLPVKNVTSKYGNWVRVYEETNYSWPEGLNCMSVSGSIFPGQDLMLGRDCMHQSMILHELMHTLGFLHEHSRPDRDDYLIINTENIPDFVQPQFDKIENANDVYSLRQFDYESVLLYGPYDGSSNGLAVMRRKDGGKLLDRSQKRGLSKSDIDIINKYYNCSLVDKND